MPSSLFYLGLAAHTYRIRTPNSAIIKAIVDGSFEVPIAMTASQNPAEKVSSHHEKERRNPSHIANLLEQVGSVSKADAKDNIKIDDVDDAMSIDTTIDNNDNTAPLGIAQVDYVSFPAFDAQNTSNDAGVVSADKCHRGRKASAE